MGKKDRIKRQRAAKQKQESEWVECSSDSKSPLYNCRIKIRIKNSEKLIRHALRIDPNYIETVKLAVAARKARGDRAEIKRANTG